MKPSEFLHAHEWIKESLVKQNQKGEIIGCCLLGAINCAMKHDTPQNREAFKRRLWTMCQTTYPIEVPGIDLRTIVTFNDYYITTKAEAIALLQQAEENV